MAKILTIQISDIHFTGDPAADHVWGKIPALIARITEETYDADHVLLVLGGDISQSGQKTQFAEGTKLVGQIVNALKGRRADLPIDVVSVPGNHDNDHSGPSSARDILLSTLDAARIDNDVFGSIDKVQDNYFAFAESIATASFRPLKWEEKLFLSRVIEVGGTSISVCLMNSAWACRKKETYGAPRIACLPPELGGHKFNIVVCHHPLEWCNQSDVRGMAHCLQGHADVILTGHVHQDRERRITETQAGHFLHIESGCLQDLDDAVGSAFRTFAFDTVSREIKTTKWSWDGTSYRHEPEQNPFDQSVRPVSRRIGFTQQHSFFLDTLGTLVKHHRVSNVPLSSIFVRPRLARQDAGGRTGSLVRGEALVDELLEQKASMIVGAESSGKTSLSKMLVRYFAERGLYAVLLNGSNLDLGTKSDLPDEIRRIVAEQYLPATCSAVKDADPSTRVVIIDDLHKTSTRETIRAKLITFAKSYADVVVILVPDTFIVDELVHQKDLAGAFGSFTRYDLVEMSYKLRHELVENWLTLGTESDADDSIDRVKRNVEMAATSISVALRQEYVPSFPLFIIAMLQNLDAKDSTRVGSTNYGHLFEAMIYQQLGDTSSSGLDLDLRVNYLANLANKVFFREGHSIGGDALSQWHTEFCDLFARRVPFDRIVAELETVGVLRRKSDSIVFAYPYLLCFFMARFLANEIYGDSAKEVVSRLVDGMHKDDYAQTLICLCHLSKDPSIIEAVKQKVLGLLVETPAFNLERDGAPLDRLLGQVSKLVIADSPDERKRVRDQLMDRRDGDGTAASPGAERADPLRSAQELNAAYRSIQIVGQILKTFSGSMRATEKQALANVAFDVALRVMATLVTLVTGEVDVYVGQFKEVIAEEGENLADSEITERVHKKLSGMVRAFGIAVVKHVSMSMGSYALEPVYSKLRAEKRGDHAVELLVFGIELDNYKDFPLSSLEELMKAVQGSQFGQAIAQYIVWLHLVLFNVKYDVRQRACAAAKITVEAKLALNPTIKRVEAKQTRVG